MVTLSKMLVSFQFVERLQLLFIPRKYQPDYVYLKYVPLHRIHLFTFIQLGTLVILWTIKSHPTTSIAFPGKLVQNHEKLPNVTFLRFFSDVGRTLCHSQNNGLSLNSNLILFSLFMM